MNGIVQVGFQNIQGTKLNNSFATMSELEAMYEIGTDLQGMAEINKLWNARTKMLYQTQLELFFVQWRKGFILISNNGP